MISTLTRIAATQYPCRICRVLWSIDARSGYGHSKDGVCDGQGEEEDRPGELRPDEFRMQAQRQAQNGQTLREFAEGKQAPPLPLSEIAGTAFLILWSDTFSRRFFPFHLVCFHVAVAVHERRGMPLTGHSHSALGGGGLRGVPHTDDVQPRADETPQRTRFTSSLCSNHRHQYAITKEWEWGQQDWGHVEAEKEHRMKAKRGSSKSKIIKSG